MGDKCTSWRWWYKQHYHRIEFAGRAFLAWPSGYGRTFTQTLIITLYAYVIVFKIMKITKVITLLHIKIKQMIPLWDTLMQWTCLFRMRNHHCRRRWHLVCLAVVLFRIFMCWTIFGFLPSRVAWKTCFLREWKLNFTIKNSCFHFFLC